MMINEDHFFLNFSLSTVFYFGIHSSPERKLKSDSIFESYFTPDSSLLFLLFLISSRLDCSLLLGRNSKVLSGLSDSFYRLLTLISTLSAGLFIYRICSMGPFGCYFFLYFYFYFLAFSFSFSFALTTDGPSNIPRILDNIFYFSSTCFLTAFLATFLVLPAWMKENT